MPQGGKEEQQLWFKGNSGRAALGEQSRERGLGFRRESGMVSTGKRERLLQ